MEHAARDLCEQYSVLTDRINSIYLTQGASKDPYAGKEQTLGHGAEPIASMLRSSEPDTVRLEAAKYDGWNGYQGLKVAGSGRVQDRIDPTVVLRQRHGATPSLHGESRSWDRLPPEVRRTERHEGDTDG